MNEFKIKHGLIVSGSADITGALNVLGRITIPNTLEVQDITVLGTASIAYLDVTFESASVIYSSGSNIFGDADNDVQTLNGDVVVNGTDFFVDASTSNVGIGTTSPSYKLTINSADEDHLRLENGSELGIIRVLDSGPLDIWSHGDTANEIFFRQGTGSGTVKMAIDSSGNVGIGTATPNRKLTVQNGSYTYPGGIDANSFFAIANDGWSGMNILSSNGTGGFIDFGDLAAGHRGRILYGQGTDYMEFDTAGSEKMRITSAGNVGIGTDSPDAKLDVESTVDYQIMAKYNATNYASYGYYGLDVIGGGNPYIFKLQGTERMRITAAGNVGIGTITPAAPLHIYKSDTYSAIVSRADWNIAPTRLALGAQYGVLGYISTGIVETTNDTTYIALNYKNGLSTYAEGLRVYNNGNVGIGTTSPAAKFQVTDASSSITLQNYLNGAAIFLDGVNGDFIGGDYFHILADGSSYLGVGGYAGGSTPLNVSNSGNVGIGTTSPAFPLHISTVGSDAVSLLLSGDGSGNSAIKGGGGNLDLWSPGGDVTLRYNNSGGTKTIGLLVKNSSGNVGIGTTAPAAKLDVAGQIITSDSVKFTGNVSAPTGNSVFRPASNTIAIGTASVERMRIDPSGNVGIGTTSPGEKLTVISSAANTWATSIENNAAAGTSFGLEIVAGGNSSDRALAIRDRASNDLLTVLGSGNVGIGTTGPDEKLVVRGNGAKIKIETASDPSVYFTSIESNYNAANTFNIIDGGSFRFGAKALVTYNDTYINGYYNVYIATGTSTNSDAANIRLFVAQGGNVGIGTTTPAVKLDVDSTGYSIFANNSSGNRIVKLGTHSSSGEPAIQATLSNNTARYLMLNPDGGNILIGTTADNGYKLIVSGGSSLASFRSEGSGQNLKKLSISTGGDRVVLDASTTADATTAFAFQTGGSERMRIDSSGNVGIGTSIPDYELQVGDGTATETINIKASNTNPSRIFFSDNDAIGQGRIYYEHGGDYMNFYTDGSERMRIDSSGNVGIGTTSPSAKLEVSADVAKGILINRTYTTSSQTLSNVRAYYGLAITPLRGGAGGLYFTNYDADTPIIQSVNSSDVAQSLLLNPLGGNVGIGTTSPAYKLEVEGSIGVKRIGVAATSTIDMQGNFNFDAESGYSHVFKQAGSELARILPSGNVGIGTTAPISALHILGNQFRIEDNDPTITLKRNVASAFGGHIDWLTNDNTLGFQIANNALVSAAVLEFNHSGVNRMVIKSDGNVGIGTTSPAYKTTIYDSSLNTDVLTVSNNQINGDYIQRFVGISLQDQYANGTGNASAIRSYSNLYSQWGSTLTFSTTDNTGNGVVEKMRITSNGNVGIGTTSPGAKLDVSGGDIKVTYNSGYNLQLSDSGGLGKIYANGDSSSLAFGATVALGSTATERMRIDGITGNVGIGTTSPGAKLAISVAVAGTDTEQIRFNRTADGLRYNSIYNKPSSSAGVPSELSFRLSDGVTTTSQATVMTLIGNGNVGIGTTSPANKLVVTSDASPTSENSYAIAAASASDPAYKTVIGYDFTNDVGLIAAVRTSIGWRNIAIPQGNLGIGTIAPAYKLDVVGALRATGTLYSDNGALAGALNLGQVVNIGSSFGSYANLVFNMHNGGGFSDIMKLQGNGNVGIGTTSPAQKLDVVGKFRVTDDIILAQTNGRLDYDNNTVGSLRFFSTSFNAERMRLTSAGNLGIGTTSPSGALHVYNGGSERFLVGGDVQVVGATDFDITGANRRFSFTSGTGTIRTTNATSLFLQTNSTTAVTIDSSQNVGIGTTSPSSALDVRGVIESSTGTIRTVLSYTGSGGVTGTLTNHPYILYANNAERMRIDAAGNVGIGTDNPGAALQISRAAATAPVLALQTTDSTSNGYISWRNNSGVQNAAIGTNYGVSDTGAIEFISGSTTNMILRSSGNLGIGTTSPGYKLDVSGTAAFGNGTGQLSAGSDGTSPFIETTGTNDLRFITGGADQMVIDSAGNVGIGVASPPAGTRLDVAGDTNIQGTLTAVIKSFTIDHPTKEGKKLQYGVLEGPEHSVYVRGRLTNENTIVLPDHWYGLVHEDTITVNLTCIGRPQDLWVQEVNAYTITVGSEQENINCFYTVFAERKDVDKLIVEFDKV